MANYNVGNIEIGAITKTNDTIAKLDKIIAKLQQVKDVQSKSKSSQSGVNKELSKTKSQTDKNTNAQKKHKQEIDKTKTSVNALARNLKGIINFGKLYAFINYTKRFFIFASRMVTYASDYVEILNKFQVSFGKLTNENIEFVEKLSKAYGFSRATLMDYQATFNNMLKSLEGLTDEMSARISRTLTQMAIDYSSLFNQSIESTMLAFQSMLSGSIRPIRSVSGFDVSETSIFAVYQELGGTKTMRQLTQLEKRLLRIIAVQQQMQEVGATGDFYRTIETFSNQVKILQEQLKEFGVIWGRLFLVKLKPAIQYLNGFLIALNEIGKVVTKNIELTDDFNIDEEFAGFEKIEGDINDTAESIDNLNNSITQLGLDQLNVLGGSKGVSSLLEIDPVIEQGLQEYIANLDKVNMKAKEVSVSILQWMGYSYNASGELEKVNNNLNKILSVAIAIVSGLAIGNLVANISKITPILQTIGTTFSGVSLGAIAGIGALIAVVVGFIDTLTSGNEKSKEWLTTISSVYNMAIKPALENISTFVENFMRIISVLYDSVILPISEMLGDVFINTLLPSFGTLLSVASQLLALVMAIVTPLIEVLAPIVNQLLVWFEDIVNFVTKILGVIALMGNVISSIIGGIANLIIDGVNWVIQQLNKFSFKMPDWLGGYTFGFNIKELEKVSLPTLDFGSTPTETLETPSEYSNITSSPSSGNGALTETFMEAVLPMTNAILKGDNEIVKAIKSKPSTFNVDGKQLAEATYDSYESVAIRKGKILFGK